MSATRRFFFWSTLAAVQSVLIYFALQDYSIARLANLTAAESPFHASFPSTTSTAQFIEAVNNRRSYYALDKILPTGADRVNKIVEEVMQAVPTAFNSQSNRAVVLYGAEHERLWDIVAEVLKPRVSAEEWESTAQGLAGKRAAAGTILLFVDDDVIKEFAANIPSYADRFPHWGAQGLAMLQFALWTALETEGLGANLQHHNPLIDDRVAETWQLPSSWKLDAQLVFGGRSEKLEPKQKRPVEDKLKVFSS